MYIIKSPHSFISPELSNPPNHLPQALTCLPSPCHPSAAKCDLAALVDMPASEMSSEGELFCTHLNSPSLDVGGNASLATNAHK